VADELNAEDFAVAGSVAHLDLIEKNGDSIRRVESFQLGQPG
jgi:hypothetical protein